MIHFGAFFRPFGVQKWAKSVFFGKLPSLGTFLGTRLSLARFWPFWPFWPKRCRGVKVKHLFLKVLDRRPFWESENFHLRYPGFLGKILRGLKKPSQKIGGLGFFYPGTFFLGFSKMDPSTSPKSRTFFWGENLGPFLGQKWGATLGSTFGLYQVDRGSGFWAFLALFGSSFWPKSDGVSLVSFLAIFGQFLPDPRFFVC